MRPGNESKLRNFLCVLKHYKTRQHNYLHVNKDNTITPVQFDEPFAIVYAAHLLKKR